MTDPAVEMMQARRGRRILGAAASISLALFVAYAVAPALGGDDEPTERIEGEVAAVVVDGGDLPSVAYAAGDAVETFEVFGGKNPFQRPLSLPASDPFDDDDDGDDPDDGDDTPTDGGSTTTTVVPATPDQGDTEPTRGRTVELLDVFDDASETLAQVRVDSTVYLVQVGDVFAISFKVVALDLASGCGDFLFGDSAFELCEGSEILK